MIGGQHVRNVQESDIIDRKTEKQGEWSGKKKGRTMMLVGCALQLDLSSEACCGSWSAIDWFPAIATCVW